jgi:hypothetical protein
VNLGRFGDRSKRERRVAIVRHRTGHRGGTCYMRKQASRPSNKGRSGEGCCCVEEEVARVRGRKLGGKGRKINFGMEELDVIRKRARRVNLI